MRAKYLTASGLALLLTAGPFWAQEAQKSGEQPAPAKAHNYNITPEEKDRKNPIKFTEVSVTRGKKIFLTQCAMCHGETGNGKGDLAQEMKLTPPDFKSGTLARRTDGELFKIIEVGSEVMPGQAKRMPETQRWNIVNFLRALSGAVPAKATGKEPEENIIEIPQPQPQHP